MRVKKITVTVAISAYNEEANIGPFLKSVFSQREEGFVIKKIPLITNNAPNNITIQIGAIFSSLFDF